MAPRLTTIATAPSHCALYHLALRYAVSFAHRSQHRQRAAPIHQDGFDAALEYGVLAHDFLILRCGARSHDKLRNFSSKRRGFFPSCGARRMSHTAVPLADQVIPHMPMQQCTLSLSIPLHLRLAAQFDLMTPLLHLVQRPITCPLLDQAGLKTDEVHGSALSAGVVQ